MAHPSICSEILNSIRCRFNKSNRKFLTQSFRKKILDEISKFSISIRFDVNVLYPLFLDFCVSKSKFSIWFVESTSNRIEYFDHRLSTMFYICCFLISLYQNPNFRFDLLNRYLIKLSISIIDSPLGIVVSWSCVCDSALVRAMVMYVQQAFWIRGCNKCMQKVFMEDEWLIRIVQTSHFDHKFILIIMFGVTILFFCIMMLLTSSQ